MVAVGHDGHHLVREFALEQFDQRADLPGGFISDQGPVGACSASMPIWILYSSDPLTMASIRPGRMSTARRNGCGRRSARVAGGSHSRKDSRFVTSLAPEARGDGSALEVHGLNVFAFFA